MTWLDDFLSGLPESDDSYHCPWFKLIEFFAGVGVFFGLMSFLISGSIFGVAAVIIALCAGCFGACRKTDRASSLG